MTEKKIDLTSDQLSEQIFKLLDEKKAQEILLLDVKKRSSITDYMVIATGTSGRQLAGFADIIRGSFKEYVFSIEGLSTCDWVLVDLGNVVVHLFKPEVRSFYNLEKMWGHDAS
jgi:ribosome-associated protein